MLRLPMFYKGLTPELMKIAEKELNETPQVRENALAELKELIREQQDISCNMEDEFLVRFLRVKNFNVQKSLQVLRNYISVIQRYSGVFTHRLPSELKNIVDLHLVSCQPYRLDDSSYVVIFRLGMFNPNNFAVEDLVAYTWAWANIVLEYEVTQISGAHLLLDLTDTTFNHYRSVFSFKILKFLICTLQDGFPIRIRGVHLVNEPYLAYSVNKVIQILGKTEMVEKIHFYGNDLNKLHENIPKEFLPQWLGGTMSQIDPEEFASVFYSYEDLFKRMKHFKINRK